MALLTNIQDTFKNAFEKDCLERLITAYDKAIDEKIYQSDWHENDFNEQICEYIRRDRTYIVKSIIVETEHKLFSRAKDKSKGFADKLPRIDFVFHTWGKLSYVHYMEAKRLKENNSALKRAYIDDGMDRFISQKYPLGNMIGYLIEGNEQKTVEGINKLLALDGKSAESLVSKTFPLHSSYYESDNHANINQLKHIILDFT